MAVFEETGSYSGHLRLRARVDVDEPGPNTTSVTVRLRIWVGTDGWNFNDGQTVSYSDWKSGSVNFNNNLSSGEKEVVDRSWSHPVGSGAVTRAFNAKLSGNSATGSSPSVRVVFRVEGSPVSPPSPPSSASMRVVRDGGSDYNPLYRLEWGNSVNNGGDGVTEWTLQIDDNDTFATILQADNPSAGARSFVTGVIDPGMRIWWRIRAWNSAGAGSYRTEQFLAPTVVPQSPLIQDVVSVTASSATLRWDNRHDGGASLTHSDIEVRPVGSTTNTVSGAAGYTGEQRAVTGLQPGEQYEWRVRLHNGTGWSEYSSWGGRFTTDQSAPTNRPSLAVGTVDATTARMTWTHTAGPGEATRTEFDYQVSLSSDFAVLFASGSVHASVLLKDIAGLTPATQYYFRVRAENSIGTGPWSSVKSLTAPQGVKVRLNGVWVAKPLYVWDGSDWIVPAMIRVRSGGVWVDAS